MQKSSAPKRILIGFNVAIQVILAAVILVVVNMAIRRWHPAKVDLMATDYYRLSEKTRNLLKSLKSPVEVYVFFQMGSSDPVAGRVRLDVDRLLKEYEDACPQIKVTNVDPDKDLAKAEKFATEFNVREANVVVFVNKTKSKFIKAYDLVEMDRTPYGGGSGRIRAFKGEQMFTSAIQSVVDSKQPKVYFLEGHGEGDPTAEDKMGCSEIAGYIQQDNMVVQRCSLAPTMQVPADCDVLVICGPETPFSDPELKAIMDYIAKNGRLMVMFSAMKPDTGLEKVVFDHGVRVENNIVVARLKDMLGGTAPLEEAYAGKYGQHPITDNLRRVEMQTVFPLARSLERIVYPMATPEKVTVLVEAKPQFWGETDFAKLQQGTVEFDAAKDRKPPVTLAIAVEPAAAGDLEREGMRLVVFGSSAFIRNGSLKGGNEDLFMGALNWLVKRQQLMGIAAKKPDEFGISLSPSQADALYLLVIVGFPILVGVVGVVVWVRRRK